MLRKVAFVLIISLGFSVVAAFANDHKSDNSYVYGHTTWESFKQMGYRCGTRQVYEDEVRAIDRALKSWMAANSFLITEGATPSVNVYFHVIRKDTTTIGGNIPDSWITAQINALNQSYSNFDFNLVSIDRTTNLTWFNGKSGAKMKSSLHQGTCRDLNVYSVDFTNGLLGYATFPNNCNGTGVRMDGVVIHYQSLPGGRLNRYNQGDTLTHEAGHWLGLYHTFQGGCNSPGDSVDDTHYEVSPAYGCPIGRDTCSRSGLDPIKNFMDYSDDSCMNTFSNGQKSRSTSLSCQYRRICG